ncbi:MAG: hypothetical protein M1819_001599 [Sarea resinae]|nr:MAG: hypothetical protein M1819_001599 [Sarea resinae]
MKILTAEEERDHYHATVKGGILGGAVGVSTGLLGVFAATKRYPAFRTLNLPLRAFLVTASGLFATIVSADRASHNFEMERHPEDKFRGDENSQLLAQIESQKSFGTRTLDWAREHRYPIVFGSWVASMGVAGAIVGRNPYLTGQQKLVQARVYAQGLTLAVLVATAALEIGDANKGKGRWETVKILDPNDPTHKHIIEKKIHHERYAGEDMWRDMVEAEERKMKEREAEAASSKSEVKELKEKK